MTTSSGAAPSAGTFTLSDIERCFGGAIPAVLTTASAEGVPNIMYLSRAHQVDHERIALSNQFMSKTARNLAANPQADLLLIDPMTHDEYRLSLVYERTDRRGHVFNRLRADVDALSALVGMQDVFRLRAADIFRVVDIEQVSSPIPLGEVDERPVRSYSVELTALAELARRIDRALDLEVVLETALVALDELFGYQHTMLLLLDEGGRTLYTIASHGFGDENVGAEVPIGEGQIGIAAERCEPFRVGGLTQMDRYSKSIRREYEGSGVQPGLQIPMPGLPHAQSRIVVPAMGLGELIGVLVAESSTMSAFGVVDEEILGVAASLLANAVGNARQLDREPDDSPTVAGTPVAGTDSAPVVGEPAVAAARTERVEAGTVAVRHFTVDASTFFDGDYLIKGVAGRILWSLLGQHQGSGRVEFTNRELRLDTTLELPGFKDNLESRLLLLKRRLDEREAPVRIEKSGRGRFRLLVSAPLQLELVEC
jgi:predicted pyridoxine 5'-phosphate oxidase superfamily flavin-nucleotide-binding protein